MSPGPNAPDEPIDAPSSETDDFAHLGYHRPRRALDAPQVQRVIAPLRDFLHAETTGGILLVVATILALIWANTGWPVDYESFWHTETALQIGGLELHLDYRADINDGLMTLFFFLVGLEIKRELVEGELRDRRAAALPALAALGGMVVPALIYLAIASGTASHGWGIPMATDIAMALGVVALLGSRVPAALKLFLLALAIVDDIGAIAVIALFYSDELHFEWLALAVGSFVVVLIMKRLGVQRIAAYAAVGALCWFATHEGGVHATVAGVALGLAAPTKPYRAPEFIEANKVTEVVSGLERGDVHQAVNTAMLARQSVSIVEWLEHMLHPWTSRLIVPLFALSNAGIVLGGGALADAATSRVAYGVVAGLVLGKVVGITAATWLAVRSGLSDLPAGSTWRQVIGVAALGGIGFTVSLFISGLAFDDPAIGDQSRLGILVASLLSAGIGALILAAKKPTELS